MFSWTGQLKKKSMSLLYKLIFLLLWSYWSRVWGARRSNHSTQHDSGDTTSPCSEATICSSKLSLYTSRLLVLNCIKYLRNVDAMITSLLSVCDSKIMSEDEERGSPKWQEVHGLWDQYLCSNLVVFPFWKIRFTFL